MKRSSCIQKSSAIHGALREFASLWGYSLLPFVLGIFLLTVISGHAQSNPFGEEQVKPATSTNAVTPRVISTEEKAFFEKSHSRRESLNFRFRNFSQDDRRNCDEAYQTALHLRSEIYDDNGSFREPPGSVTELAAIKTILTDLAARSKARSLKADGSIDQKVWTDTFMMYMDSIFLAGSFPRSFVTSGSFNTPGFSNPPVRFGAQGFNEMYDDRTGNQAFHMFSYVKISYLFGSSLCEAATVVHEIQPMISRNGGSSSRQDYYLGVIGNRIGTALSLYSSGKQGGMSPETLAASLDELLTETPDMSIMNQLKARIFKTVAPQTPFFNMGPAPTPDTKVNPVPLAD
ncbi:MAG: hypothetical protein WA705_25920 [Candidatus Ozemobacteraceae bacterium]